MKRVRLGIAIAALILTGAGALVYASVPHTFNTGDTLQAADLNGNFSALDTRISALEAGSAHWDGYLAKATVGLTPSAPSATVAHVTFTPPATGAMVVRAHFSTAIRNNFDTTAGDCNVVSQLSTSTTAPPVNPTTAGTLGISEIFVAGNLPTESGGGSYQWFPQTAEAGFAVTAGTPLTVNLNGILSGGCVGVVYYGLNFSADFVGKTSTVTVTTP
jgi:hypothetical protein